MNSVASLNNPELCRQFSSLRKLVDKQRKRAIQKRLSSQPQVNNLEYLLGAFFEMYEPHLKEIVLLLYKKGYAIDVSSGFGGKFGEFQAMTGDFSIDYVIKNKLERIGVKFREYNGSRTLIFWPERATIKDILAQWMKIIDALPNKGRLTEPASNANAINFRRKYIPKDLLFRKQRLFEKLKFKTLTKVYNETKRRQKDNSHPKKIELMLGLFMEEIEPQVREAIIRLNQKGYSTDKSGFMDNPCMQMIEGDFRLDEKTQSKLEMIGVTVETNPSGYTRLQFSPLEPDINKIKRQWNQIVSLLPTVKHTASISMTRQARDFRTAYQ